MTTSYSSSLLPLHRALDSQELWEACSRLLMTQFTYHMVAGVFCFSEDIPHVFYRTGEAKEQDEDWWRRNCETHPLLPQVAARPELNFCRVTDMLSVEEIRQTDYYREFVEPEGWLYSVGIFLRSPSRDKMIGLLAVNRREDQGEFTEEEMARFADFFPHLEAAFQRVHASIRHQLTRGIQAAYLRKSKEPLAVLSREGEILFINQAARQACGRWTQPDAGDVNPLQYACCPIPEEVLAAVRNCPLPLVTREKSAGKNAAAPAVLTHPQQPGIQAVLEWVGLESAFVTSPMCLVRFRRLPDADKPGKMVETDGFDLSLSERAVAGLACQGLSNKEIALHLGKSPATVKTQLESVYRKLGIKGRRSLTHFRWSAV